MATALEQLKQFSIVVADTGDFEAMKQFKPRDATTNPTLLLQAVAQAQYAPLMQESVDAALGQLGPIVLTSAHGVSAEQILKGEAKLSEADTQQVNAAVELAMDEILTSFGRRILELLPAEDGRVSSEVDAKLSFDTDACIARARRIIGLYKKHGVDKKHVLIKLASTWEGLAAAKVLEHEDGIHCNMTLLFSTCQAIRAAEVGATLISPFVGRIYDWHVAHGAKKDYPISINEAEADPGVNSVTRIYRELKARHSNTEIMAASFRNVREVLSLAGCDLLTVSPQLLGELANSHDTIARYLKPDIVPKLETTPAPITESEFRYQLNSDEMGNDKLSEGIRRFDADARKLEGKLRPLVLEAILKANAH